MIAHSLPDWIVNTRAVKHIARDHLGFVEYLWIPTKSQWVYVVNSIREDLLGVGTYQLKYGLEKLTLHDILYALRFLQNLLNVFALIGFSFNFSIHDGCMKLYLDKVLYRCICNLDDALYILDVDTFYNSSYLASPVDALKFNNMIC